eukprot:gene10264-13803_t
MVNTAGSLQLTGKICRSDGPIAELPAVFRCSAFKRALERL